MLLPLLPAGFVCIVIIFGRKSLSYSRVNSMHLEATKTSLVALTDSFALNFEATCIAMREVEIR